VDALHQFVIEKGQLREVFVTTPEEAEQGDVLICGSYRRTFHASAAGGYFELVTIDLSSNIYPD